jgi:hypothetical protein
VHRATGTGEECAADAALSKLEARPAMATGEECAADARVIASERVIVGAKELMSYFHVGPSTTQPVGI